MDMATALKEITAWPADQQIELVARVWDQVVASGWRPSPTPELETELDRRLDALDANPGDVLTWEQVVASVRRKV